LLEVAAREYDTLVQRCAKFDEDLLADMKKAGGEMYARTATLAYRQSLAESPDDFTALLKPVYDFLNKTPDRVPMTDWYWTNNAKKTGFQARPVVGGVLIKMLTDPALVKKWVQVGRSR
jgi:hypothetical protein